MNKWKQLDSQVILDTKYFRVKKDSVELPNGEKKEDETYDKKLSKTFPKD